MNTESIEYVLDIANYEDSFRTEDGTLLVRCLFTNGMDWYDRYIKESDVSVGSVYLKMYKPTKKDLYKVTFRRKED